MPTPAEVRWVKAHAGLLGRKDKIICDKKDAEKLEVDLLRAVCGDMDAQVDGWYPADKATLTRRR